MKAEAKMSLKDKRKRLLLARLKQAAAGKSHYTREQIEGWYRELQDINDGLWTPNRRPKAKKLSAQEMLDRVTKDDTEDEA